MDPYSYGYNRATPLSQYLTPQGIVTTLVDIISKNGNFLLDIGPTANGTIIAIEQDNLRAAGRWIHAHAEAIFNTTYWFVTPEEGEAVRFTQNANAFYITTLFPPNGTLVLESPVPYVPGDAIEVVGGGMAGKAVPSRVLGDGSLEITVSEAVRDADEYCWVFKIPFGGVEVGGGGGSETSASATASSSGYAAATATSGAVEGVRRPGLSFVVVLVLGLVWQSVAGVK